jgi:hypothetical protein
LIKFKTKDHGALAGLQLIKKKQLHFDFKKTKENVDVFMDVLEKIVYDPNSRWFGRGSYQGGTGQK